MGTHPRLVNPDYLQGQMNGSWQAILLLSLACRARPGLINVFLKNSIDLFTLIAFWRSLRMDFWFRGIILICRCRKQQELPFGQRCHVGHLRETVAIAPRRAG